MSNPSKALTIRQRAILFVLRTLYERPGSAVTFTALEECVEVAMPRRQSLEASLLDLEERGLVELFRSAHLIICVALKPAGYAVAQGISGGRVMFFINTAALSRRLSGWS